MADVIFNSFARDLMSGAVDLDTDTIKVMLVTSSYSPDKDAHTKRSDVSNEVTGTGYSSGGIALSGQTVSVDNTDNEGVFDAANTTFTGVTVTARGCVLYKSRGGASSADELICYKDFGSNKSASGGIFTITWDAEGILNLTT